MMFSDDSDSPRPSASSKHPSRRRRTHRGDYLHRRKLLFQSLEDRRVLTFTGPALGIEQVGAVLQGRLTGATIITNGFQVEQRVPLVGSDGDSMLSLATAVRERLANDGKSAYLVDYDILAESGNGVIDAGQSNLPASGSSKGDLILLWDWAFESNEASPGWTQAVGDALVRCDRRSCDLSRSP